MSHVTTISIEVRSLDALKSAAKELGYEFIEGQKKYTWFGKSVGDYPLPQGMKASDLGKCSHVVRIPGVQYEIGVVKTDNGYTLAYDFWGPGSELKKAVPRLTQMYGIHVATLEAHRRGFQTRRVMQPNGAIQLRIGGLR